MMKYKSWVASRAQEGLPTRGGISQPPSRANSIRDADGIIPVIKERESFEERPMTGGASITRLPTHEEPTTEHTEKTTPSAPNTGDEPRSTDATAAAAATAGAPVRTASPDSEDEHDEEDDQIHDALPPEMLETSGDTCAICIDTLEDDDDVRGLTCGHAFHAVCLDPWLTSRRACCPLCKADYYTPKPRPQAADGAHGTEVGPTVSINPDPRGNRMNMPSRPGVVWVFHPRRGRFALPSFRNRNNNNNQNQSSTQTPTSSRTPGSPRRAQHTGFISRAATAARVRSAAPTANNNSATPPAAENQSGGFLSSLRMPRFNMPGRSAQSSSNNNSSEVTPSNLEAGTRTGAAR